MSLDIKDIHMNIFDNIFSGSNGIANKLIDIFGTEAYYVRFNNDKTYDPKTDTYTNNEEIRKLITITPPSKYKSYDQVHTPCGKLYRLRRQPQSLP